MLPCPFMERCCQSMPWTAKAWEGGFILRRGLTSPVGPGRSAAHHPVPVPLGVRGSVLHEAGSGLGDHSFLSPFLFFFPLLLFFIFSYPFLPLFFVSSLLKEKGRGAEVKYW